MNKNTQETLKEFKITGRKQKKQGVNTQILTLLNRENAEKIKKFHETFPMYQQTPLAELKETAKVLGLGNLYVKDESYRFGLNAFKVLGGSHAIGKYLAGKLGKELEEISYDVLISEETREKLGDITFVTATDGNHGRGVAWTANQFKQKSVVYMPKGSAQERLDNIRAAGADASITDMNYDDAVRLASKHAQENEWVLVQDTAWEGYEEIPTWIMQGYETMGLEALEQLPEMPTHIFLQAGVGSMAAAIAGFFVSAYQEIHQGKFKKNSNNKNECDEKDARKSVGKCPMIVIVEPNKADCFYQTAEADDGKLYFTTGDMDTIMAGLACGEPCSIAWDILKDCADYYISFPDYAAAKGMRILGNPVKGDTRVIAGESGASAFGCVAEIMSNPELINIKEKLHLDENSKVLFFNTEGDTDKENYKAIVWDGKYPSI